MPQEVILFLACMLAGLGVGISILGFLGGAMPEFPTFGPRGEKRQKGIETSAMFRLFEPCIRLLGHRMGPLLPARLAGRLDRAVTLAGEPWGLSGAEIAAVAMVLALAIPVATRASIRDPATGLVMAWVSGLLGGLFPVLKVLDHGKVRIRRAEKDLPFAIDLLGLAMNAGMDFLGALKEAVRHLSGRGGDLAWELGFVLKRIELGRTKREALEELATRLPGEEIRGWVSSVVQSEERGTPLVDTLRIQSGMLRNRQSQKAEQAAARASLLLLGPLMLIFVSVFLVLLGPFAVKAIRGELF